MRNEHCGVPSPPRAWHTLLYRDPPSHVPRPPECWALPVPWPWPKSCPRWGGKSHGSGSGRPQTYCILMPPQPAMGGCTPLTCARLAEPSQLLAVLAVPPDTCGAGDTGAGRSGYRLRSCPRPARHGAGGIAGATWARLPWYGAAGCPSRCSSGVGPPRAMEPPEHHWPQLAAFSLLVEPQPHPKPALQACGLQLGLSPPSAGNNSSKGMAAPWHVPPGWYVP